jgi:hypothetical protein
VGNRRIVGRQVPSGLRRVVATVPVNFGETARVGHFDLEQILPGRSSNWMVVSLAAAVPLGVNVTFPAPCTLRQV